MDPRFLHVGDEVASSGVGGGKVTGWHQQGGAMYPEVNGKAVGRLTRSDGAVFGPLGSLKLPDDLWQPPQQAVQPVGLDGGGAPAPVPAPPAKAAQAPAPATPAKPATPPATAPAKPAAPAQPAHAPAQPAAPATPAQAPAQATPGAVAPMSTSNTGGLTGNASNGT